MPLEHAVSHTQTLPALLSCEDGLSNPTTRELEIKNDPELMLLLKAAAFVVGLPTRRGNLQQRDRQSRLTHLWRG